jgi:hypothetical protein
VPQYFMPAAMQAISLEWFIAIVANGTAPGTVFMVPLVLVTPLDCFETTGQLSGAIVLHGALAASGGMEALVMAGLVTAGLVTAGLVTAGKAQATRDIPCESAKPSLQPHNAIHWEGRCTPASKLICVLFNLPSSWQIPASP